MREIVAIMDGTTVINVVNGKAELVALAMPDAVLIDATEETGIPAIGGDLLDGRFRDRSPYPSWKWDSDTWTWQPPIPQPDDDLAYYWDEETGSWIAYPVLPLPPE